MTKHEIKISPDYFEEVAKGSKTFEIRYNDRGFKEGDEVVLHEWNPKMKPNETFTESVDAIGYTGRKITAKVGYVFSVDQHLVVFSLLGIEVYGGDTP